MQTTAEGFENLTFILNLRQLSQALHTRRRLTGGCDEGCDCDCDCDCDCGCDCDVNATETPDIAKRGGGEKRNRHVLRAHRNSTARIGFGGASRGYNISTVAYIRSIRRLRALSEVALHGTTAHQEIALTISLRPYLDRAYIVFRLPLISAVNAV